MKRASEFYGTLTALIGYFSIKKIKAKKCPKDSVAISETVLVAAD
jgi:hypothetical protein